MIKRIIRFKTKWWLMIGSLFGVGMLPCPECGAPMILHFWPLAGMVMIAQAMRKRTQKEGKEEQERSKTDPVKRSWPGKGNGSRG